jgi:hypothetical protein
LSASRRGIHECHIGLERIDVGKVLEFVQEVRNAEGLGPAAQKATPVNADPATSESELGISVLQSRTISCTNRNVKFTIRNIGFTIISTGFTIGNVTFAIKNINFAIRKIRFTIRAIRLTVRKTRFTIRQTRFTTGNDYIAARDTLATSRVAHRIGRRAISPINVSVQSGFNGVASSEPAAGC